MTLRGVGISFPYSCPEDGVRELAVDLEVAKSAGPDFVEVFPDQLGVILGGGALLWPSAHDLAPNC
jgi:hypothetical protein